MRNKFSLLLFSFKFLHLFSGQFWDFFKNSPEISSHFLKFPPNFIFLKENFGKVSKFLKSFSKKFQKFLETLSLKFLQNSLLLSASELESGTGVTNLILHLCISVYRLKLSNRTVTLC